jgi:hypothetical protein
MLRRKKCVSNMLYVLCKSGKNTGKVGKICLIFHKNVYIMVDKGVFYLFFGGYKIRGREYDWGNRGVCTVPSGG